MSAWQTLAGLAEPKGLIGGPFGSNLVSRDYQENGVPVIRGANMGERFLRGEFVYVSQDKYEGDLARNVAQPGDLIFTQRGTLGQVSLVPRGAFNEYVISQSQMRLRVDEAKANPDWVYYYCTTDYFIRQIDNSAISVGVPHINLGILSKLQVPRLLRKRQDAIAEVLGALDDKIAANELTSTTMDRLIRSGYSALKGDCVPLGSLATNIREQIKPENMDRSGTYLGLEHLPREHFWVADHGYASEVASAKARFEEGDVLFGKLRPYFHKVVAAPFDGVCSTDILVVRAIDTAFAGLVLAAVGSKETVAAAVSSSEGTRMPRTSWNDLSGTSVRWPGHNAAVNFSIDVQDQTKLAANLGMESQALARTRDELLPLLMSGKVTVKDAEKVVSDAV